jgi:putative ABC transport system permease protein
MRWLWKKDVDDEVAEELELHLEMRTQEYVARGLDPAAAREAALRRFGDLERVRTQCREIGRKRDNDMRRREYFGEIRQDVTFALRQLLSHPAFSLIAVLTLALGIGATTAIFSVVNAVVLRPLPVPEPDRLTFVNEDFKGEISDVSAGNFIGVIEGQRTFSSLAAKQFSSFNLAEGGEPERAIGGRVSASYFDVFGIRPLYGRVFRPDEDAPGSEHVAVLSHRLWKRRFGADPGILGKDVRMNGRPYEVIGVMPASFDFTANSEELWVPIAFTPERKAMHDEHYLTVVGRLRDGVTLEQARQDLAGIAAELKRNHPQENSLLGFRVESYMSQLVGDYRTRLFVLLGAVGLVLLIACGNVANLLLARATSRWREVAIRTALGAGRGRIIRQLLTESAVLALVSAIVGLFLSWWGMRSLVSLGPSGVPRLEQTSLDGTVLAFTLGVSVLCSGVFGLAPALRAARSSVASTLKEGGRGSAGARRDLLRPALISVEVALSVLLLVGAGLLIRSALELQRIHPGFKPAGVISARVSLPVDEYRTPERVVSTLERIAKELAQAPGVRTAAVSSYVPMAPGGNGNGLLPEGAPLNLESTVQSQLRIVTPDYFGTMGIRILRGRGFEDSDRSGSVGVAVVNEEAAEALFPGQDPIGKRFGCCEMGPDGGPALKTIVGVAENVRGDGLAEGVYPEFYLPVAQAPKDAWDWIQRTMYVVARGDGAPESLLPSVRGVVGRIDSSLPLYQTSSMEDRMRASLATARFNTLLLALLGTIGLILAAVGIYSVIAYYVTQRTPEIGVRIALGATPGHVVGLVLRQAALPVGLGLLVGILSSLAATRVLEANLVGVDARDPVTLASVVAVLAVTALLASILPARRAAHVDPKEALLGA